MSRVHAILRAPYEDGGPCPGGLSNVLYRLDLNRVDDLTAEVVRTVLVQGCRERTGVGWWHLTWFLRKALLVDCGGCEEGEECPECLVVQEAVRAVRKCPMGTEGSALSDYYTVTVEDDVNPEEESACPP